MLSNSTLFFPLHCDLDGYFSLIYQSPDGQWSLNYHLSLTLIETILQSLATTAAMSLCIYKGLGRRNVELKSKVLFVCTHKEQVTQSKIEKIDKYIQRTIQSSSYYHDYMVQFASKSFAVSNTMKDEIWF